MTKPSEAIKNYSIKTPTGQLLVMNQLVVHTPTLMAALGYPDEVWDEMYEEGHSRIITIQNALEICRKSQLETRHWIISKMEEIRDEEKEKQAR